MAHHTSEKMDLAKLSFQGPSADFEIIRLLSKFNIKPKYSMPKFIIEREIPGAGRLTSEQLKAISQKSRDVICKLGGTDIQWVQSYVAGDKIYCVYIAASEEIIMKHAQMGGFPANLICKISTVIEPTTADI